MHDGGVAAAKDGDVPVAGGANVVGVVEEDDEDYAADAGEAGADGGLPEGGELDASVEKFGGGFHEPGQEDAEESAEDSEDEVDGDFMEVEGDCGAAGGEFEETADDAVVMFGLDGVEGGGGEDGGDYDGGKGFDGEVAEHHFEGEEDSGDGGVEDGADAGGGAAADEGGAVGAGDAGEGADDGADGGADDGDGGFGTGGATSADGEGAGHEHFDAERVAEFSAVADEGEEDGGESVDGGMGAAKEEADEADGEAAEGGEDWEEEDPSAGEVEALDEELKVMNLEEIDALFEAPCGAGGDDADNSGHGDQEHFFANAHAGELLKDAQTPDAGHPDDFTTEVFEFQELIQPRIHTSSTYPARGCLLLRWRPLPGRPRFSRHRAPVLQWRRFVVPDRFRNGRGGR